MNARLAVALAIVAGLAMMTLSPARADLIWDNNGATEPNPQDGTGDWNTTNSNWWNNSTSTNVKWSNESPTVAQFGLVGSTGTVTVAETGVTATGLTFKKNYTLQTGPVTLAGTAPVVGFASGAASGTAATINSNLTVTDDDDATADDLILRGASPTISNNYWKAILGGSNSYSGELLLEDGVLCDVNSAGALSGTKVVVKTGTTLRILAPSGTFGEGMTLELSGYGFGNSNNLHNSRATLMFAPGSSGSVTWSGDVILLTDVSIASTSTATVNTISGDISGAGKLTKNSDKTLALTGTCAHTGGTNIYRGALQVDGTLGTAESVVTVGTSSYTDAALKGIGSVLGDVLVNSVGTIEAGDSVGTLTVDGDVTVNGKFKIEYDSLADTIDRLIVDGDLNLGGATMSFTDVAATPEALAASAGPYVFATYTGTLTQPTIAPTGIPEGYSIAWAYGGNSIALVPEPAALALVAGLALALAARRIRRR